MFEEEFDLFQAIYTFYFWSF